MKYVQLASFSTPAAVSTWFQDELVNRGVDAAYTYYVLSLLRGGTEDSDQEDNYHSSSSNVRQRNKRFCQKNKSRKECAVECLESAADSNEGFEALVEELLIKLKTPHNSLEQSSSEKDFERIADKEDVDSDDQEEENRPSRQISLAEQAKLYFDAFPALQVNLRLVGNSYVESNEDNRLERRKEADFKTPVVRKKENKETIIHSFDRKTESSKEETPHPIKRETNYQLGRVSFSEDLDNSNYHHIHPKVDMGSMYHEESLISNLARKFDSKLAAIWADAPSVDKSPWLSNVKESRLSPNDVGCDDVIFSIPNDFSVFEDIHQDDDIIEGLPLHNTSFGFIGDWHLQNVQKEEEDELKSVESFQTAFSFNRLGKNETTDSKEVGEPVVPTLCLKNSTLNYDREKTAFSEVVPSRKVASVTSGHEKKLKAPKTHSFSTAEDDEDLLISPRTHFTPIRLEAEDLEERPPSSSLGEMTSYNLPPEPPKRSSHNKHGKSNQKPPVPKGDVTSTSSTSHKKKKTTTEETKNVSSPPKVKKSDESVKALWKMVEPEKDELVIRSDILGVAQYWNENAITYSGASNELRQEILAEEDELLQNIFTNTIQNYDIDSEETNEIASENVVDCSLEESSSFQKETTCSLEYLSNFSAGVNVEELFSTPEIYDSAIVTSVRSIQDLQRSRKKQQKKPCTFYMEGNCRRTDCKFSHDLSAITCRFWEEGSCFKGMACPFLHGYATLTESTTDDDESSENHGRCTTKKEKRAINKFAIGQSLVSSSFNAKAIFEGRATVGGIRVSRRLPVFRRLWPSCKESEQDFPSLNGVPNKGSKVKKSSTSKNQKLSGNLPLVTKKTAAATKKKKKKTSTNTSGVQEAVNNVADNVSKKKQSDIGKKSRDAIAALLRERDPLESMEEYFP